MSDPQESAWKCVAAIGALLIALAGCAHTRYGLNEGESAVAVDGDCTYAVMGRVVDAVTKAPLLGAKVSYTEIDSTYPGELDVRGATAKVMAVALSDEGGAVDAVWRPGWYMNLRMRLDESKPIDQSDEMLNGALQAAKRMESTFCIDVSKEGYRTWAKLFTDSTCRHEEGRAIVELGEVELFPIEDAEGPREATE